MSEYHFLPVTAEQLVDRFAQRAHDVWRYISGESSGCTAPSWVEKMGKAVREQTLAGKICAAIDNRDEPFLLGLINGMIVAVRHCVLCGQPEAFAFPLSAGLAFARKILPSCEIPEGVRPQEIIDQPELTALFNTALSEIYKEKREARTRFLEGMIEGSDLELLMLNGPLRPGLALDTQLIMLFFWPELDAMKTRREAYEFIQFLFKDTPSALRGEEAFIKLAKSYGFKSHPASREDSRQGSSPSEPPT